MNTDIDIDSFITPNKHEKYSAISAFEQHKKMLKWMTLKRNNIMDDIKEEQYLQNISSAYTGSARSAVLMHTLSSRLQSCTLI